jgi:hypothetical protein
VFRNNKPNDLLFLMPVRRANEKLPRGKVRMLACDITGRLCTSVINRPVYELAREIADSMVRARRPYAVLGLETEPGRLLPVAVEIDDDEVWAMERILEHALKNGELPDILKRYLKPIMQLGESRRSAVLAGRRHAPRAYTEATPRVLDRLPYYAEDDIEFSMPIYKAEYGYPLIVLKSLPTDGDTPGSLRRLLVLDSDGDLAVIKAPSRLMNRVARERRKCPEGDAAGECLVISRRPEGLAIDYMHVSRLQKRALDTLIRHFEENGQGRKPISAAAKTVLSRAREKTVPSPQ